MENYVGKRLDGRYEIIEIIGVGGMAVVYKAYDNIDNRIVAVKILKDEYLTNEEFRRRFKNESKAIAVLSHPNIVKVFDVSYGDRLQYIVMEYVEGITLKEYISQQGTIDIREAIYFVTQILRALQHAHDKGIVHRDIKPQNIMLIADGTIKVTDFGIARFARSDTKTMTETAIGSVHYISPEQAKGSVMDAKTDIYSVGVVLYEMLTGKLPFQSENAVSVALMQLQNEPEKPRNINPDIPVGLEQIVMRAMQKNPNDRYQSASEMLMDIDEYKKNPNIKFDYSYYVDRQPTRYIPTTEEIAREYRSQPRRPAPQPTQPPRAARTQQQTEREKKERTSRKRTLAIMAGLLTALVIFAAVLIHYYNNTSTKVDVPYLVGKNFQTEVMNADAYSDFHFSVENDDESTADPGTILAQSPEKGKVERGSMITLKIAAREEELRVPDVYGFMYTAAQDLLKAGNFEVKIEKVASSDRDPGTVIRTSPARDEKVTEGQTITLYVATVDEAEPVEVPDLMGMTVSEAEEALEEAGLELDSDHTEYRASSETRGKIIGYESNGESVAPGTKIAVYVSTGHLPTAPTTTTTAPSTTSPTTTTSSTTTTTTEAPTTTTAPSTTSDEILTIGTTTSAPTAADDEPELEE